MPSAPIHLQVAMLVCDRLSVKDMPQFLLGSVAPDSVNLEGFAPKEVRHKAHARSISLSEWKESAGELYATLPKENPSQQSFALGVLTHIMTDILWDEFVQPTLFEAIKLESDTDDSLRERKWLELYRYNSRAIKMPFYKEAIELLKKAEPTEYRNISSELMASYRDYLVEGYKDKLLDGEPVVLCEQMVVDTADRVLMQIKQII